MTKYSARHRARGRMQRLTLPWRRVRCLGVRGRFSVLANGQLRECIRMHLLEPVRKARRSCASHGEDLSIASGPARGATRALGECCYCEAMARVRTSFLPMRGALLQRILGAAAHRAAHVPRVSYCAPIFGHHREEQQRITTQPWPHQQAVAIVRIGATVLPAHAIDAAVARTLCLRTACELSLIHI